MEAQPEPDPQPTEELTGAELEAEFWRVQHQANLMDEAQAALNAAYDAAPAEVQGRLERIWLNESFALASPWFVPTTSATEI